MRRRILIGAVAGLGVIVALGVFLFSAGADVRGSTAAAARPGSSQARFLGPVPASSLVHFGLSLQMRSAAMTRYADVVAAGHAPSLDAREIGRRFGLSTRALTGLRAMLSADGVSVEQAFPQRTQLLVRATAGTITRLLGVRLGRYVNASGQEFQRPLGTPRLPAALRSTVAAATMLDTTPRAYSEDVPGGGVTAADLAALYDLKPLINAGLNGAGQTVAIFSGDTFLNSDIAQFDQRRGISGAPAIERVPVRGPVPFQSGDGAGEVDLDTEVIQELAPQAHILDYEIAINSLADFGVAIDRIVRDGRAKLVNFSYGACELLDPQTIRQSDNSFKAASIAGVTVFVSSGDQGAYECGRGDPTNHQLTVAWPGSSPYVVSVGGTHVDLRTDSTRLDEFGWEGILSRSGGGGGLSRLFPRAPWQTGVAGIQNQHSNGNRQVPDVAADAAPSSGYAVFSQGQSTVIGGTSAAAPLWTGAFVLIDQLAQRRTGHLLPFIAPLLYRAAARDPQAFYDVMLGGNRYYRAGPGWDYSTGLGAPDFARLANDVIALASGK